jgi:hypothetical protein
MNNKLKEIKENLPKNCCSFCTHLSLSGPSEDYTYKIKCVLSDSTPEVSGCCDYFEPEYTKLNVTDLDESFMNFLDICLRVDYEDYLNSAYWQLFKESVLEEYDHKCNLCGTTKNVEVIHLNKNLGRETFDDVAVICNKCLFK